MTFVERMQQEDKVQHIICAFLSVFALQFFVPVWQAGALVFLAGLLKEVWDFRMGTGFCWYDLLANLLGILFAPIALLQIG